MSITQQNPVLIVGAGLSGLTFALALHKFGIPFRIVERAPELSEIGAGITLWENALKVLEYLGVADRVLGICEPSAEGILANSRGGILVNAQSTAETGRLVAAHRSELQGALYRALPEDTVSFGVTVRSFETQEAEVKFETSEGERGTTPLLVGADGLFSSTRRALFGDQPPRFAGYAAYRGVCVRPPGYQGPNGEFLGRGDRFGVIALPGGRLYWYAVIKAVEGQGRPKAAKPGLQERFQNYAFEVPRILEATEEEAILYHDVFDRPPASALSRGRVVLLGDAAHPTTPNMGQGAAMGMESALVLARALAELNDVGAALAAYEALRRPRTARVTATSRRIGQVAQLQNGVPSWLRDGLFRLTPASVRVRELRWVAAYDAATVALR